VLTRYVKGSEEVRERRGWAKFAVALSLLVTSFLIYLTFQKSASYFYLSLSSSLAFWSSLGILIFPKIRIENKLSFLLPFTVYLVYHSLLYGIVLGIVEPGGLSYLTSMNRFSSGYGYAIPPSDPLYFPLWVFQSPAVWFFLGVYEADVVPYSLFLGIVIGELMGLNVSRLVTLNRERRTLRLGSELVLLPGVSLVSGASCCLALPTILLYTLVLSVPSMSYSILLILRSPAYFAFMYYGLPLISAGVLYLNLRLITRASETCRLRTDKKILGKNI